MKKHKPKVMQQLCSCSSREFTFHEASGMWVCRVCMVPTRLYYIGFAGERPFTKIKHPVP